MFALPTARTHAFGRYKRVVHIGSVVISERHGVSSRNPRPLGERTATAEWL